MTLIATGFQKPFTNLTLTQSYGVAGQLSHLPTYRHLGEDYGGTAGSRILAAASGIVVSYVNTSPAKGFGNYVILEHTLPDLSKMYTLYAHLDVVNVAKGQEVTLGSQVGTMGSTGASTGPHLHFEVSAVNKFEQAGMYGGGYDSPVEWKTSSKSTVDPSAFIANNPLTTTHNGSIQSDRLWGMSASETFYGKSGNDVIHANAGNDKLFGGDGMDSLYGGSGNDILDGGGGRDFLSGGSGSDIFDFNSLLDSAPGTSRDTISDFAAGYDKIDLSGIDANSRVSGNQAFNYIGAKAFSGTAGQLRMDNGYIQADTNGDRTVDFEIYVSGFDTLPLGNFIG